MTVSPSRGLREVRHEFEADVAKKPITTPESGNAVASRTSALPIQSTSSTPGRSGTFSVDPVASTT